MTLHEHQKGPVRVLVASSDDHLRDLLSWSLTHDGRFRVVAGPKDTDAVLSCPVYFEVAIIDLSTRGLGILGTLEQLIRRQPAPGVVVVTHIDARYLRDALAAEGVSGYLVIPDQLAGLPEAILRARPQVATSSLG